MHLFANYSKGQMKIQEMSFVLIAIMIFFCIAALIFFKITLGNLSQNIQDQRSSEASELVRKIAQTPEFSFTSFGDCSSCLDLDKAFSIKDLKSYNNFFNLEYLQFEIRYPNKTGECSKTNYPNCATVTLGNNSYGGDVKSSFVALCRVDYNLKPYKKCELGMVHAAGKNLDSFLGGNNG